MVGISSYACSICPLHSARDYGVYLFDIWMSIPCSTRFECASHNPFWYGYHEYNEKYNDSKQSYYRKVVRNAKTARNAKQACSCDQFGRSYGNERNSFFFCILFRFIGIYIVRDVSVTDDLIIEQQSFEMITEASWIDIGGFLFHSLDRTQPQQ